MALSTKSAPARRLSAASLVEAAIVMQSRYGDYGERELDLLLHRLRVEIIAVTTDHAELARSAFRRFGKGRHSAGLNYGDCFAYALAAALGEPLRFAGHDFAGTDGRPHARHPWREGGRSRGDPTYESSAHSIDGRPVSTTRDAAAGPPRAIHTAPSSAVRRHQRRVFGTSYVSCAKSVP